MKKIVFFSITCLLTLSSCTDYLNKPITEDLSVEELRAAVKRDTDAVEFYEEMKKMKIEFLSEESKQVKFGDITYRQIYDYLKKMGDSTFYMPISEEAQKEWETQYGSYKNKVDSISDYWKKFKKEHSLDHYAKIEFNDIEKDCLSNSYNFGFKITPLKGKMDMISFYYFVRPKLSDAKEDVSVFNKDGWCHCWSPIHSPVVRHTQLSDTLEEKFKYSNTEEIKKDYTFTFSITGFKYNGKYITNRENDIPIEVREYWYKPYLFESLLIREFINPNYKSVMDIFIDKLEIEMEKYDKKCHDLFKAYHCCPLKIARSSLK